MKALVAVKQVMHPAATVRVRLPGVVREGQKLSTNPFCEVALECALRLKESGALASVACVTVGPARSSEVLRTALALGADRAIHVLTSADQDFPSLLPAHALEMLCRRVGSLLPRRRQEPFDLVLLGKLAIDSDAGVTGPVLAQLLGLPLYPSLVSLKLTQDGVEAMGLTDHGEVDLRGPLPAVATADLRLAQPRFPPVRAILKARSKPIEVLRVADLALGSIAECKVVGAETPRRNTAARKCAGVDELIDELRKRGCL